MKKSIFTMGAVLAMSALALTNCAKDELAAPSGNPAAVNGKLAAAIIDTKTAAEGLKTTWGAGDAATVFHCEAAAATYVKDGKWTADAAGATTNFTGNISTDLTPAAGTFYNWYMCYPHKANLTSPTGTGAVFTVGAQIQKQAEFDSRAHMCGDNVPLAGRAMNVDGAAVPEIAMNNLCTAIEFNITNKTSEWLRLHAVDFIGPDGEIIAGNFNVDFTGDVPAYTADPANKTGNISVRIGGGAVVLPDASAKVYAAAKPFTAPAGSTLKVRVNGYEKTLAVTEPIEFAPGHIRTFNVAYDEPAVDYSGEYFIGCKGGDGKTYIAVGKSVVPSSYDGSTGGNHIMLSKGCRLDGNVLYYDPDMDISGQNATLSAAIDDYKLTITKVTDDPYKGMYLIKGIDSKVMYTSDVDEVKTDSKGNSVDFEDLESLKSQGLDGNAYFNISADGNGAMYIVATSASMTRRRFAFNYSNGNCPRFTCFDEGTTSVNAMLIPTVGCAVDPLPRFAPIADISCSAAGVEGKVFEVSVENNDAGWAINATPDGTVVTDASVWSNEITYSTVANNDESNSLTGYIVLSLADPNSVLPDVVDTVFVTVNKKPNKFYKKVTSEKTDWTGKYLVVYETSATSGAAMYTDTKYADAGTKGLAVDIMEQGIPAVYDDIAQCVLDIQPWDGNGGTDYGQDPGEPTWKMMLGIGKTGIGIGMYNRDPDTSFGFNNNAQYSRFRNIIHYDTSNGYVVISCMSNKSKGFKVGYFKYDTEAGTFGFTTMTDHYDYIQLYEYVE